MAVAGAENHARQVLEVDLVHDAGIGRHDLEIAERVLAPAQERVAFAVTLELDACVVSQGVGIAVVVHLHGVVDDHFGGRQRIDLLRVAAQLADRVAHGRQVDDAGHAGEVLHDDARRREGNFVIRCRLRIPVEQRLDVAARHIDAIFKAQQVLQQDLQRERQARQFFRRQVAETPDVIGLRANLEFGAGFETVRLFVCHRETPRQANANDRPTL